MGNFPEDYEKATMRPYGYLQWICIQQHKIVVGLERIYFLVKTTSFIPVTYFIPLVLLLSHLKRITKKEESAELQAMHNSKKQMDTLMGRHDLPSEIKAQEIGKA